MMKVKVSVKIVFIKNRIDMISVQELIENGEITKKDAKNLGSFDDAELPFYSAYIDYLNKKPRLTES